MRSSLALLAVAVAACAAFWLARPRPAHAHCDTLDGPVVTTAEKALEDRNVTPVLKWVKPEYEQEVSRTFHQALVVRKLGTEARELADMYFFETLVRLHRAGEGAPYTGIKPPGAGLNPAVIAADKALETGSVDQLVALLTEQAAHGIRDRFARASHAKEHADDSVEAGREFVEAYVTFVHYAERLYADATGSAAHQPEPGEQAPEAHQHD